MKKIGKFLLLTMITLLSFGASAQETTSEIQGLVSDGKAGLATSLGAEDQVLTDMICAIDKSTKIFTLDTGRVFPETYKVLDETNKKYDINVEVYFPKGDAVEEMVNTKGINLFYQVFSS